MRQEKASSSLSPFMLGWLIILGILAAVLCLPVYVSLNLGYWESKGPFKNWTQVLDLDGDSDLDVLISHTRWEDVDISWAGVGMWINHGDGTFELQRDWGYGGWPFGGFAAGAGDVDQDADVDVFTMDKIHINQGGVQGGELGKYFSTGGIDAPYAYDQGYRDMGGTITLGDLNGEDLVDAFVAGCCYGMDSGKPGIDLPHAPSASWVWINDGRTDGRQTGHILPLEALDGYPIRQAALGDLDGDGDEDVYAAVGVPTMGAVDVLDDLILLNDGIGNLTVSDLPLGHTDSTSVALGDANGDGHLDALVGTSTGAKLMINQGIESGSGSLFTPSEQSFPAAQTLGEKLQGGVSAAAGSVWGLYLPYGSVRTTAAFLSDLDGDGDLDALLARLWGAEVWWNDGQGEFTRSGVRLAYREDTGVAVADFDGDGDLDIFAGRNEADYQVWWNDGQGAFSTDR